MTTLLAKTAPAKVCMDSLSAEVRAAGMSCLCELVDATPRQPVRQRIPPTSCVVFPVGSLVEIACRQSKTAGPTRGILIAFGRAAHYNDKGIPPEPMCAPQRTAACVPKDKGCSAAISKLDPRSPSAGIRQLSSLTQLRASYHVDLGGLCEEASTMWGGSAFCRHAY